jgi:hypothetical protein
MKVMKYKICTVICQNNTDLCETLVGLLFMFVKISIMFSDYSVCKPPPSETTVHMV